MSSGYEKDYKFVEVIIFDPINCLDPEKKFVDLHMFDGASVCRKAKQLEVVYPVLSIVVVAENTCHNI